MTSDEYTALLDAFLDGELSGDEAERVRAHLDSCAACRAYLDDALAIRAAFASVEDTEVPEGFAERVMDALPPRRGTVRARFWTRAVLPLAAALAVVVLARGFWPRMGSAGGASGNAGTMQAAGAAEEPALFRSLPEEVSAEAAEKSVEAAMDEGGTDAVGPDAVGPDAVGQDAGGTNDMDAPLPAPSAPVPYNTNTSTSRAAVRSDVSEAAEEDGAVYGAEAPSDAPAETAAQPEAAPESAEPETPDTEETIVGSAAPADGNAGEYGHTIMVLPPEAAPLLSDLTPLASGENGDWYGFAEEDGPFRELLKALAAAGIQPVQEPPDYLPGQLEEPYLIFVRTETP